MTSCQARVSQTIAINIRPGKSLAISLFLLHLLASSSLAFQSPQTTPLLANNVLIDPSSCSSSSPTTKTSPTSPIDDAGDVQVIRQIQPLQPGQSRPSSQFSSSPEWTTTTRPRRTTTKSAVSSSSLRKKKQTMRVQSLSSNSINQKKARTQKKTKFLTREQEVQYVLDLRTMRQAIRLRDELVQQQEKPMTTLSELQWAQAWRRAQEANATLTSSTTPTDRALVIQLRLVLHKGQAARTALCTANGGLVTSLAKKHYSNLQHAMRMEPGSVGTILTVHDLIQEGNLGILEAAERFCPTKGVRFSTYAVYWIRQRIGRAACDIGRAIRLPAHVHGLLRKVRRARLELLQEQQQSSRRGPKNNDNKNEHSAESFSALVAQRVGLSEERLRRYQESSRNVVSLEAPLPAGPKQSSSGGGSSSGAVRGSSATSSSSSTSASATASSSTTTTTLGDLVASDCPTPEEAAQYDAMQQDIWHVMETELSPIERQVIWHRFGFCQSTGGLQQQQPSHKTPGPFSLGTTVADTARALNMSRDRVRLVEARALNKLRHPQKNYRLRNYVEDADGAFLPTQWRQKRRPSSQEQESISSTKPSSLSSSRRRSRRSSTKTPSDKHVSTSSSSKTASSSASTAKPSTTFPWFWTDYDSNHFSFTSSNSADDDENPEDHYYRNRSHDENEEDHETLHHHHSSSRQPLARSSSQPIPDRMWFF